MSHLVSALYHDRDKANLAAGDLQSVGVNRDSIEYAEGLSQGSGRLEIRVLDMDQAIDVRSFLEQDGAHSVEIRPAVEIAADGEVMPVTDPEPATTIPTVPAPLA